MLMHLMAHVKWFTNGEHHLMTQPITLLEYIIVILAVVAGLLVLSRIEQFAIVKKIYKETDKKLRDYRQWLPTIIRLTTAAYVLLTLLAGDILAPNVSNTGSTSNIVAVSILSLAGILLLTGLLTRPAAVLLALGYFVTFLTPDAWQSFDHLEYLAAAVYLFLAGGGPLKLRVKGFEDPPPHKYEQYAVMIYRILIGAGLSIVAFSEKLFNIDLSLEFLQHHSWNVLSFAGVSDRTFILFAGMMELLIGLSFVFNIGSRITSLMTLGMMTLTMLILGPSEIIGHIFAIGLVAAVWLPESKLPRSKTKPA